MNYEITKIIQIRHFNGPNRKLEIFNIQFILKKFKNYKGSFFADRFDAWKKLKHSKSSLNSLRRKTWIGCNPVFSVERFEIAY